MSAVPSGLNTIVVDGGRLLLGETAGGIAVHLIPIAIAADDGRPAVPTVWFDRTRSGYVESIASYSAAVLLDPCWSRRTLCGIEWQAMAAGEAGLLQAAQEPQLVPTCRRCLSSLDRHFPRATADERIGILAVLIAQAVEEHGSAEVLGVPGDQLTSLRAAVRRELQRRFGFNGKTYVINDHLLVTCDEATEQVRLDKAHKIVRSLGLGIIAGPPPDDSGWRLHWHTWAVP